MRKNIHPNQRYVVFVDTSCGKQFRMMSSLTTDKKVIWEVDGKEYPMFSVETSSSSHPVYTGKARGRVAEGRVAKFNSRFGASLSST